MNKSYKIDYVVFTDKCSLIYMHIYKTDSYLLAGMIGIGHIPEYNPSMFISDDKRVVQAIIDMHKNMLHSYWMRSLYDDDLDESDRESYTEYSNIEYYSKGEQ